MFIEREVSMSEYKPRIIDKILEERLEAKGAILLEGPKWCGKTTTAAKQAKSILRLQDPDKLKGYLATIDTRPSLLLQGDTPRLIDEWQVAPVLWDAVRVSVDDRGLPGQYILTGSTSVDASSIMHTGTGRISSLYMSTMSLFESDESNGKISLRDMFAQPDMDISGNFSDLTVEELIFAACRGGWPSSLFKRSDAAKLFEAKDYINAIANNDISTVDGKKKTPELVRAILASYARNVSTLASFSTMLKDVGSNYGEVSRPTFDCYMNALSRLFVTDELSAWCPAIRSASSMRSARKKEFTDPSMAVAALGLSPEYLMTDLNTFGFIFECLCIRDLKAYTTAMGGRVSYYHDRNGLEADCVLHLEDGRYALIEFKLGSKEIEMGAKHLLKLQDLIKSANEAGGVKIKEPSLLMVITGGEMSLTRKDGVHVVPIGCLRD